MPLSVPVTLSLRLRLALWFGALTAAIVVIVCLYSYAVHGRTHYDTLDVMLRNAAAHIDAELSRAATDEDRARILEASTHLGTDAWLYDADGRPRALLPTAPSVAVDVRAVLEGPERPAYPRVSALAPGLHPSEAGRGTLGLAMARDGTRWRVLVLPDGVSAGRPRYLVTALPLAHIDASVRQFGLLMAAMAVLGCVLAFLVGWVVAGRALRPVGALTDTARSIAQSRVFSGRVTGELARDELGRLARTFNEMLASLELAYAAQQRFVSDASHELRAPITVIQANLELLHRHAAMPASERERAVAEASAEATRLARLVADLLVLARADAGIPIRRERVELDRVLMRVVGETRHIARGQRLEVESVEPVLVEGDPDRLTQLFLILLDNAVKYTPAAGRISIALRRHRGWAEVTVNDTGIGIPVEDLPRVFERFYRADPARSRDPGGTGLGLGIARWIAVQHGGSIDLASAPGSGTSARVRLPLAGSSASPMVRGGTTR